MGPGRVAGGWGGSAQMTADPLTLPSSALRLFFCGDIFVSPSRKLSRHTLLSHSRLPSGDCATQRYVLAGRSKRLNGFWSRADVSSACDSKGIKVAAADSAGFFYFFIRFFIFFADHRKKYNPTVFPGDMANISASGSEHVTHNENHVIDRQCLQVTTGAELYNVALANGWNFRTVSRKVDFRRSTWMISDQTLNQANPCRL